MHITSLHVELHNVSRRAHLAAIFLLSYRYTCWMPSLTHGLHLVTQGLTFAARERNFLLHTNLPDLENDYTYKHVTSLRNIRGYRTSQHVGGISFTIPSGYTSLHMCLHFVLLVQGLHTSLSTGYTSLHTDNTSIHFAAHTLLLLVTNIGAGLSQCYIHQLHLMYSTVRLYTLVTTRGSQHLVYTWSIFYTRLLHLGTVCVAKAKQIQYSKDVLHCFKKFGLYLMVVWNPETGRQAVLRRSLALSYKTLSPLPTSRQNTPSSSSY